MGELERGDSGEIPTERVAELSSSCHHLESEEGTAPPHSDRWHLVGSPTDKNLDVQDQVGRGTRLVAPSLLVYRSPD